VNRALIEAWIFFKAINSVDQPKWILPLHFSRWNNGLMMMMITTIL
jgi:hypothetical protein